MKTMKTTRQFLRDLRDLGVQLWDDDGYLGFRAPEGVLTAELFAQLKARKVEILDFLRDGQEESRLVPIPRVSRREPQPLSFAQERLWLHNQIQGANGAYNMPLALRLRGPLSVDALEKSLQEIVRRHESLRTTFIIAPLMGLKQGEATEERPVQLIQDAHLTLTLHDLAEMPASAQALEIKRLVAAEASRPFDLRRDLMLRATLLQLGSRQEKILLLTMHHIASDGWSFSILQQELKALYSSFINQQPSPLPPLPIQYVDYALWQRGQMDSPAMLEHLDYWRTQLAGAPTALDLPTDRPRPPIQSARGTAHAFTLPATLSHAIKRLTQQAGCTLFTTLLAAFKVLLHRYSGQSDILVGASIAGRNRAEVEPLIGFFLNNLIYRTDLSDNPTFHDLLQRVHRTAIDAYAHQDYPFDQLLGELQIPRDASRNPLAQVRFGLHQHQEEEWTNVLRGIEATPLSGAFQFSRYDLNLRLFDQGDTLTGWLSYNTDLFNQDTIARMATHFQQLLQSIVAAPSQPIAKLSILSEAERRMLLVDWNQTQKELPIDLSFHQLFEQQAAQTPNAIAVVAGDQSLTYRQLNQRANQLARLLVEQRPPNRWGGEGQPIVALLARRSLDFLTAMLAIFKAGAIYLPLDPRNPADRHRQMLAQSDCVLILVADEFKPVLNEALLSLESQEAQAISLEAALAKADAPSLRGESSNLALQEFAWNSKTTTATHPLIPSQEGSQVRNSPLERGLRGVSAVFHANSPRASNLPSRVKPHDLAYVIFTSGSTGLPKGAMIEQQGMLNHLYAKLIDLELTSADQVAQTAPQSFDISVWQFLAALLVGGTVHIYSDEIVLNPRLLLERVQEDGISIWETVPSLMRVLIDTIARNQHYALSALRWLIPTGEALPPQLANQWLSYYPNIPLLNAYGPTECSDDVTHYVIDQLLLPETVHTPIGRPVVNMRCYVLDQQMEPVPIGVPGELWIGGVGVGRGYLNDPQRTAAAFKQDPFSSESSTSGARLYKTGDRVRYLSNGSIEFLGRLDHQVKVRGFRIELGEIEAVLLSHPAVRECLVMVHQDESEEGVNRLVAYVVASGRSQDGRDEMPKALREHLKQKLPDYMVPAFFVLLPAMPLTPNGKIDRRALPAPGETYTTTKVSFVAPQTALERTLAEQWQRLLNIKKIGRHDNFFEIGGDSIRGAILINQLQQQFQEMLYVVALFDAPTIAQLALYLQEHYPAAVARVTGRSEIISSDDSSATYGVDFDTIERFRQLIPPLPPMIKRNTSKNRRAVFVLSAPRSGSTLFRVMLAGHPQLFSPPELDLLGFNTLAERAAALEGRFSFRLEGLLRAVMDLLNCDVDAAKAKMADLEAAALPMQAFYRRLQGWVGDNRLLVDKTPIYALSPQTLRRAEEYFEEVHYIHLLRHPAGMIRSFEEARTDQVFFRYQHDLPTRQLAELVWTVSHQNILDFLRSIPAARQLRVKYEALVAEPARITRAICDFLHLPYAPQMAQPYADKQKRMTDGIYSVSKMLGDPKFHSHRQIDPNVAHRWRAHYTEDFIGQPTWQLAISLGYTRPTIQNIDKKQTPSTSFVPLRRDGHRAPLFLIHPVSGVVFPYLTLSSHLDSTQPVYALQARGIYDDLPPFESLEALATATIDEMKTIQPHGPYAIGGWSFGGMVAFEIARQLTQQGDDVSFLGVIDTYPRQPARTKSPDITTQQELQAFFYLLGDQMGADYRRLPDDLFLNALSQEEPLDWLLDQLRQQGHPSPLDHAIIKRVWRTMKHHRQLIQTYQPQPYQGTITLFCAQQSAPKDGIQRWQPLTPHPVDTVWINAEHQTILNAEHAETVGRELEKRLQ